MVCVYSELCSSMSQRERYNTLQTNGRVLLLPLPADAELLLHAGPTGFLCPATSTSYHGECVCFRDWVDALWVAKSWRWGWACRVEVGSVRASRYYSVWAARHVKHGVYNWPEHQSCLNRWFPWFTLIALTGKCPQRALALKLTQFLCGWTNWHSRPHLFTQTFRKR